MMLDRVPTLTEGTNVASWWMGADKVNTYLKARTPSFGNLTEDHPVAYFCAEFGLHESFQQYSGGLGILAGDHCKEASDMGLPFVAIGLFYRLGFFRQALDPQGRQEHVYVRQSPESSPVSRVVKPGTKEPLFVSLDLPGRSIRVAVWRVAVGRVPLILLDTDVEGNALGDRQITAQLYTRGRSMRFHQELVLGVGGVRVLEALGIQPSVYHMNEGHSALLIVERLRTLIDQGHSYANAASQVKSNIILTIHTPVTAGNEKFDASLVRSLLAPTWVGNGVKIQSLLKLGVGDDGNAKVFDMTAFALRHSRDANGVSLLHGHTADDTWKPVVGMGIRGVTNGVHVPTWLGPEMLELFVKHGANLEGTTEVPLDAHNGSRGDFASAAKMTDRELWDAHTAQKTRLGKFVSQKLVETATRHGLAPGELDALGEAFNPEALTIGFARRFATYKRASLLFSDAKRLIRIFGSVPLQFIFAGKAHPADGDGQALIAEVARFTQDNRFAGKVFLLEDYDMEVGRMLTQGVDVWLNNPRRPLEASGTSGMKAAANGVPNASVLDGWWDEAYVESPRNGWAIGGRKTFKSVLAQDKSDAAELYRVLESEILPVFGDRDATGLPREWIGIMRRSIATSLHDFSTRRMIMDYVEEMYDPSGVSR